ncbi:alpha/beta hydrolase [Nonomuraea phyllanthi]|uniref:alpha/beta hydrolase family protein n=1 Tax=Nonomuraea phyllanthi TaxID=2219224 RepID=UPI0012936233|nr:alpha/beta fold hydrolase [Nonomuraea phyllanthi]QFY05870.1 alpha/beta hydrolase [Nonomuraea phyllanthi]
MRRTLLTVTMSLAVVAGAAAPALAARPARLALPEPTGARPVGTTDLYLVDESRPDPWNPEASKRELLVSLWYPARKAAGRPKPYMSRAESAAVLESYPDVPPAALTKVRTHARVGAPVRPGRLPLVLMSPGFSFPRATLTSLAEELASRGYLVAAVEHTYESAGTTFPDGRTTTCLACVKGQDGDKVAKSRVKDMRFVLDELLDGRWGKVADRSRIAMVGHSMGGYAAAQTMLADTRIKAGVNLDGTFKVEQPLDRPFMLVGTAKHAPGYGSWDAAWANLTGQKRWITVAGTDHAAFVDYAVLRPSLGLPAQELDGARALKITRAHLVGFLDRYLLGKDSTVEDYPEVTDHSSDESVGRLDPA